MRFDLAINIMTLNAVQKGKIFVIGGGTQWRPFVHVSDAARAFIHLMDQYILMKHLNLKEKDIL